MKAPAPVLAVVAVFVLLGGLAIGAPALWFLLTYGCQGDEDRLTESLTAYSVFDHPPAGAQPQGIRETSCESDARIVEVGQLYRLPGKGHDVLGFYHAVAHKDGWRPSTEEDVDGFCVTKAVGGQDVVMSVSVREPYSFYVKLSSSVESGGWC
jgi:hypothetical protein